MDDQGRALERQAGIGSLESRAALLGHKLRRGDVHPAAVELASFLGSEPARLVIGHGDCPVCSGEGALPGVLLGRPELRLACPYAPPIRDLIPRLREAGLEIYRRTALLFFSHVLRSQGVGKLLQEAIGDWIDEPSVDHAQRLQAAYRGESQIRSYSCRDPLEDPGGLIVFGLALSSEEALCHVAREHVAPWLLGEPGPIKDD